MPMERAAAAAPRTADCSQLSEGLANLVEKLPMGEEISAVNCSRPRMATQECC